MRKVYQILFISIALFSHRLGAQVTIEAADISMCSGPTVAVDVTVANFSSITSMQFAITWDETVLEYSSISNNLPPSTLINDLNQASGEIRFSWFDFSFPPTGQTFNDGDVIFTINFDVLGGYGDMTNITLGSIPGYNAEIADINGIIPPANVNFIEGSVSIEDSQDPVISNCPSSISQTLPVGQTQANISWTAPTATDDCNLTSFTSNYNPGDLFNLGITTVNYTATDEAGNTSICSFDIELTAGTVPPLTFTASDETFGCNSTTATVEISVENFESITSMQFGIEWDESILQFEGVNDQLLPNYPSPLYNDLEADNGELRFSWFDFTLPPGLDLTDGTVIFSIDFTLLNTGMTSTDVVFTNFSGYNIEVANTSGILNNNDIVFENSTLSLENNEPPVIAGCPDNMSLDNDSGQCGATVSFTLPTVTDDCDAGIALVQISALGNNDFFPEGTNTVLYEATDNAGNTASCQFDITVNDVEDPIIDNCPNNISADTDSGLCTAIVNWSTLTATDNCSASFSINSSHNSGDSFDLGDTTVNSEFEDEAGNTASCSFVISVSDNEAPNVTGCPDDIIVNTEIGTCSAIANWVAPSADDNCDNSLTESSSHTSGDSFPLGFTTVSYDFEDDAGNIGNCTFEVEVKDGEAPTVNDCPDNLSINTELGTCSASATWNAPSATDNCSSSLITTNSYNPGDSFTTGLTTVSYEFEDESGNSSTCTFDIEVIDAENPVISNCPENISTNNDSGVCSAIVTWDIPTATDNCSNPVSFTTSHNSGDVFSVGTTIVDYVFQDEAGNSSNCTFSIEVIDNEQPSIVCPDDITVAADVGTCEAMITWDEPVISDNCPGFAVVSTVPSGTIFQVGLDKVVYLVTDAFNNSANCIINILVIDETNPVISNCPDNITVSTEVDLCTASVSWTEPSATDECPMESFESNFNSGDDFSVGTTTVTYTATDENGNASSCSFDVTVEDDQAPVFTSCNDNIFQNVDPGNCNAVVNFDLPIASDNCPNISVNSDFSSGDIFPLGSTLVTCVAEDASGNSTTCSFSIVIFDNENPTVACPGDLAVAVEPGMTAVLVNDIGLVSSEDNCGIAFINYTLDGETMGSGSDDASGSTFNLGETIVTYIVEDEAGNMANCSFIVDVVEEPVITLSCPADVVVDATQNECSSVIDNIAPIVDPVENVSSISFQSEGDTEESGTNDASGLSFNVGSSTVTYEVESTSGDISTCTFQIQVQDFEPPVFTICPTEIVQENDENSCEALVNWSAPEASDNCSGVVVSSNFQSGTLFPIGSTMVMSTATDAAGNTTECNFEITVMDDELPQVQNCPENILQNVEMDGCTTNVSWIEPNATDNCSVTFTSNFLPGEEFEEGVTTVSYIFSDAAGNSVSCDFTVEVVDETMPQIACPSNLNLSSDPGVCGAAVIWDEPIVSDNCSNLSVSSNFTVGEELSIGTTMIVYEVSDMSGNTNNCSFEVTIEDTEAPTTILCPGNINVNSSINGCSATEFWFEPIVSDNCGVAEMTSTHESGSTFEAGQTPVIYSIFDEAGNEANCFFTVNVIDNQSPSIVVPDDIIVNNDQGECGALADFQIPQTADNCGVMGFSLSTEPGSFVGIGTTVITATATDDYGNTTIKNFNITVIDNEAPVINCPQNIEVVADGTDLIDPMGVVLNAIPQDCENINLNLPDLSATDNCGVTLFEQFEGMEFTSGTAFPLGASTLSYRALDEAGNESICSFEVTVLPISVPAVSISNIFPCEGETIEVEAETYPNATYTWFDSNNEFLLQGEILTLSNIDVTDAGLYTLEIDIQNCELTQTFGITVFENPVLNASANDLLCTDGEMDLNLSVENTGNTNVNSWIWYFGNAPFSNEQNPTLENVDVSNAGTYSVTAFSNQGCSSTASVDVSISTEPTAPQIAVNDDAICIGETIELEGETYTGNTVEYIWQVTAPGGGVVSSNTPNTTATPTEGGDYNYSFYVVVDGCATDEVQVAVNVQEPPTIDLLVDGNLECVDGTTSISLIENNGNANDYLWEFEGQVFNNNPLVVSNITSENSGNYKLIASSSNGCESTASIDLNITDKPEDPSALILSDSEICLGESISIEGSNYGPSAIYHWNGEGLPGATNNNFLQIQYDVVGNFPIEYWVEVDNCLSNSVLASVAVQSAPEITPSIDGEVLCVDGNTDLSFFANAIESANFEWFNPSGNSFSNEENPVLNSINSSLSGNYTLVAESSFGCKSEVVLPINITDGLPSISAQLEGVPCEDENLRLLADLLPGASYEWKNASGNIISNVQSPILPNINSDFNGLYEVVATRDGCTSTATVDVQILDAPTAIDDEVAVIVNTPTEFDVSLNDGLTGEHSFTVTILENPRRGVLENLGNGLFRYTPEEGSVEKDLFAYEICYDDCQSSCDIAFVNLNLQFQTDDCVATTVITPNGDGINDQFTIFCLDVQSLPSNRLVIFNVWGDKVFEQVGYQNGWKGTYEGGDLPDGTYYYIFQRAPNATEEKGFVMIYR